MALTASTYQYISQIGVTRLVDASAGPEGPHGTVAFLLIGSNGWHNGVRLPSEVAKELKDAKLEKQVVEGVEYLLVPEVSTNLPGRLSHYAERTGVADLENPPGGGVNAARQHVNTSKATVDPEGVAKYVEDKDDAFVENEKLTADQDSQLQAAIRAGEGKDEGKEEESSQDEKSSKSSSSSAQKSTPKS